MRTYLIMLLASVALLATLESCTRHEETKADNGNATVAPASHEQNASTIMDTTVMQYRVLATVTAVNEADTTITINHQAMEGFMDAMTMAYKVGDPSIFKQVRVGTHGHVTIKVVNGTGTITSFHVHEY